MAFWAFVVGFCSYLEVTREVCDEWDAELGELRGGPDTGEQEEVRSADSTRRKENLVVEMGVRQRFRVSFTLGFDHQCCALMHGVWRSVLGAIIWCTGCAAHNFIRNNVVSRAKEKGRMISGSGLFQLVMFLNLSNKT